MITTKISGDNRLELEVGDIVCNEHWLESDAGTYTLKLSPASICEVVSVDTLNRTVTIKDTTDNNAHEFICANRNDELCSLKMVAKDFSHISNIHLWAHVSAFIALVLPLISLLAFRYFNFGYMLLLPVLLSAGLLRTAYILLTSVSLAKERLYRYLKQSHREIEFTEAEK